MLTFNFISPTRCGSTIPFENVYQFNFYGSQRSREFPFLLPDGLYRETTAKGSKTQMFCWLIEHAHRIFQHALIIRIKGENQIASFRMRQERCNTGSYSNVSNKTKENPREINFFSTCIFNRPFTAYDNPVGRLIAIDGNVCLLMLMPYTKMNEARAK